LIKTKKKKKEIIVTKKTNGKVAILKVCQNTQ